MFRMFQVDFWTSYFVLDRELQPIPRPHFAQQAEEEGYV